ncbi:MAG: metallophosphoesterase [Candidatus Zixiibacteriota bacterium]
MKNIIAAIALAMLTCSTLTAATARFAMLGDYGYAGSASELAVANLIKSWNPDFIVTAGDNSYNPGTIDANIGQYYHDYIGAYAGAYGSGSPVNRFFPCVGNHEYSDGLGINAYLTYFTLPGAGVQSDNSSGNERYYDFIQGPVHFFAINSNIQDPDGIDSMSVQAQWLKSELLYSPYPWNIVFFHHGAYSSATTHGSTPDLQWPYENWGADLVVNGHDHSYERVMRDDNHNGDSIPYFINGLGGRSLYTFPSSGFVEGSTVRYAANYGAMQAEATDSTLILKFYSVAGGTAGTLIDSIMLRARESCCKGFVGNINANGGVDLSDLSSLVEWLTGAGVILPCEESARFDRTPPPDLDDLSALVKYIAGESYRLPACPSSH